MTDRTVAHSTFVVERNYPAAPQQVFRALSDPARKRRWFAEGEGFEVDSFEMDFRVGGFERSRFRFKPGMPVPAGTACANDTVYLDIINNERIVVAYTMTVGGNRMSSSQSTFELVPDGTGTKLVFTEQAAFFANADGPQMREQGWRALLDQLAKELAR
jgi:uncharacterized protein YndB with AHSA1/START domain